MPTTAEPTSLIVRPNGILVLLVRELGCPHRVLVSGFELTRRALEFGERTRRKLWAAGVPVRVQRSRSVPKGFAEVRTRLLRPQVESFHVLHVARRQSHARHRH